MSELYHGVGHNRFYIDLDPRARLVSCLVLIIAQLVCTSLIGLTCGCIGALLVALVVGGSVQKMIYHLLRIEAFVVFILLMLPFSVPGDTVLTIVGFSASEQGIERAYTVFLKVTAAALFVFGLLASLRPNELGFALQSLRVPPPLVTLLLMTMRYIELFGQEYVRLRQAMRIRAFRTRTTWHTWRSLGWLIGMLLVRGIVRAQCVYDAMRCRAFRGVFPVQSTSRWRWHDTAWVGMAVMIMLASLRTQIQ